MVVTWSERRFTHGWAVIVLAVGCGSLPTASAADADLSWAGLNATMAYSGIDRGKQYELCREHERGIKEWNAPFLDCGVALPSGSSEFRLPQWEALNPTEHLDLVRDIFYWMNALASQLWDSGTFTDLQLSRHDVVPEMRDAVWLRARPYVMALIADHRVELQRSRIDVNFDGKPEWVYRMSQVGPHRTYDGKDRSPLVSVYDETCKKDAEPGDARRISTMHVSKITWRRISISGERGVGTTYVWSTGAAAYTKF